ncbi:transmembrane protein 198-B [Electrophorus electricus]|uniref:Transmembrane protein 198 n=2 Tax=Electrophorus TaxID=8004 RepID=A0A4W4GQK6_ELEEL|nr:transmembrane protein 198-B [Electrophorus electricus]XP_026876886.1 transmembrane protein 198-B [Electrophorus electricus]XP_035379757.1 transmembrane protein 198-B [Electrophorus electricus]
MTSMAQLLAFKMAPPSQDASMDRPISCDEEIERHYEVVPSVVCSMCCLFGIIYCFFGYRCFKAVMFLTGLMFGSVIIFLLCYKERVLDTQLSVEASVGIGLGIGTLCGLVTMLVRSVGLFMVGLLLGLLAALASLVVLEEFYHPRTVWLPLGVLLGSGMLFAVLALQWQRCFTTLSTAVFGSAVVTVTVDYFVELFALTRYIYERVKVAPARPVCWYTWVVMGVWPVLAVLGVLIQWKVTAEGYSHTEVFISHQRRRVQLMKIRQKEERRETRKRATRKKQPQPSAEQRQQQQHKQQPKYHHPPQAGTHPAAAGPAKLQHPEPTYRRKPNPIRRYNGDVLSPSYIQHFRDRHVDRRGYSHGRLIGGSHMVDMDYDCGSQVPLTAHTGPAGRV